MNKYYNDKGELAVLYHDRYGTGWYEATYSEGDGAIEQILFEPEVVQWVLEGKKESEIPKLMHYIQNEYDLENSFESDTFEALEIRWIPKGTKFTIFSDEGLEQIFTLREIPLIEA